MCLKFEFYKLLAIAKQLSFNNHNTDTTVKNSTLNKIIGQAKSLNNTDGVNKIKYKV